ncbi:ComF family protein [Nitratireductor mangrovi]|uniref:ComF family protein n=1 Tax=Nitratireductor mangrovi TaxID=2599600 RepID=A0A5B8L5M5_9HYPH|nr:ComF family protein [Nitratireductor mangrovi]QDZ03346.1 ComF family protein [Nitratireductor mangrovi]
MAAGSAFAARVLFPPVCGGCRRLVSEPGTLCGTCWRGLRLIERPFCEVLGMPFAVNMGEGAVSAGAIAEPPPFARARAAVAYSGVARRLVQGLKYRDRTDLAPWMARWMVRAGGDVLVGADMIVPVPLHRRRFFFRRFNQAAELARTVARLAGVAFEPTLVVRARRTRQQVGLGLRERETNVRGAFRVPPAARPLVKGKRVLVIDDVYTTGATVSAMARCLNRSGAAQVDILTFARVIGEDFRDGEDGPI